MKNILLILTAFLFHSCEIAPTKVSEPLAGKIRGYIEENCPKANTCQINLKDITDFPWDKLYFFSSSVEDTTIKNIIGVDFSSPTPYYSNKMFFINDDQVVSSELHIIPDVDKPFKNGDVDIQIKGSQAKYAVFDHNSSFEVERIGTDYGEFYRLNCTNCE